MNYRYLNYAETEKLLFAMQNLSEEPSAEEDALQNKFQSVYIAFKTNLMNNGYNHLFTEGREGYYDCLLCGKYSSNPRAHIRGRHEEVLWMGNELTLEECQLLHTWIDQRLRDFLGMDARNVIQYKLVNTITFPYSVSEAVKAIPWGELKPLVIEDNKCKICDKQVKGIRAHLLEYHLADIEFAKESSGTIA